MTEAAEDSSQRETFVHAVVDPHHWYPLEMKLQNRPTPGFPQDYVIACRRSHESGIADESRIPYEPDTRFGEWDQRISYKMFQTVLLTLDSARIHAFPTGQEMTWFCQAPPGQTFRLTYSGRTYEWSRYESSTGWEQLEAAIELMLAAVMQPLYVDPLQGLVSVRREMEAERVRRLLSLPETKDD